MGVLQTTGSAFLVGMILLTLSCATIGFASQTLQEEKTQMQALTDSGLIAGLIKELSTESNSSIPPAAITTLASTNLPLITSYLSDTSQTLDFNLALPDSEFTTLFGALLPCQPAEQPLQNGKVICKPNAPVNLITATVENTTSHVTSQTESKLTTGFSQAKQGIIFVKKITWITFILALVLILSLLALNHDSWASALAWTTVALGITGFLLLALAVLGLRYLTPFLPTDPAFLNAYLLALLTAVLSTLKIYSLIILGATLGTLFGSFYFKSK